MPDHARPHNFDVEFFVKGLDRDVQRFHYYVTSIDKPKIDFSYEEINQYGYRHNILTGIKFQELSLNILDDTDNKSLSFLYAYLDAAVQGDQGRKSKTTRFTPGVGYTLPIEPRFANVSAQGGEDGSGVIIQEIKIHQYVGAGISGAAAGLFGRGGRIRTWSFLDPQLTNIDMSTLAHDSDDVGSFDLTFNYKNVSFALDGAEFPDTPFGLLRAAAYADLAEGIVTAPPSAYVKAATNAGSQLAATALNTGGAPGVSGGAVIALGEKVRGNDKKPTAVSATTSELDKERNKNGYVQRQPAPTESVDVRKPVPDNQAAKLAKL